MIETGGKEAIAINAEGKNIVQMRKDGHVVWEANNSCFGRGYWDDNLPWDDDAPWNDG